MFLIEWLAKLFYGEDAWEKAHKKQRPKPKRRR
jgi:hypothetical protein